MGIKTKPSNISQWIPNENTQNALLAGLKYVGYLKEDATVEDITIELLESIPPGYIGLGGSQIGQIPIYIDAFIEDSISENTLTGLNYIVNGTIYVEILHIDEDSIKKLNWREFPSNGNFDVGAKNQLAFHIDNSDGKIPTALFNELRNFVSDPNGLFEPGTLFFFLTALGEAIADLDVSTENYKSITIKNSDFKTAPIDDLGHAKLDFYIYDNVENNRYFIDIYSVNYNETLNQWEATYDSLYEVMWNKIMESPERYSLTFQFLDFDEYIYYIGTQTFNFSSSM